MDILGSKESGVLRQVSERTSQQEARQDGRPSRGESVEKVPRSSKQEDDILAEADDGRYRKRMMGVLAGTREGIGYLCGARERRGHRFKRRDRVSGGIRGGDGERRRGVPETNGQVKWERCSLSVDARG
jgi:hypothetical protein